MNSAKLAGNSLTAMRKRVLAWYARNKRAMPWRGTRNAYRVWVSEIMLQQTRVAAVLPYYQRFVKKFPTVRALARARSEEVLRMWAGLGYYSRARNLHRAAKEIVARHGGKFPREYGAALALPGVGRYTAAAVLSIAYGEPLAVVDGNVARVVARLSAMRGDVRTNGRWKKLEERAQELLGASQRKKTRNPEEFLGSVGKRTGARSRPSPSASACGSNVRAARDRYFVEAEAPTHKEKADSGLAPWANTLEPLRGLTRVENAQARVPAPLAGEWNQAMMELGATLCTPRAPRCEECPVARWCRARELGIAERLPPVRPKREPERVEIAAAVMVDAKGRTLLVKPKKAEANDLFSGMWHFPAVEVKRVESEAERQIPLKPQMNTDKHRCVTRKRKGAGSELGRAWTALPVVKHTVTFRDVTLRPFLIPVREFPATDGGRVVALDKVEGMAVSSATRKIAQAAGRAVYERSIRA